MHAITYLRSEWRRMRRFARRNFGRTDHVTSRKGMVYKEPSRGMIIAYQNLARIDYNIELNNAEAYRAHRLVFEAVVRVDRGNRFRTAAEEVVDER